MKNTVLSIIEFLEIFYFLQLISDKCSAMIVLSRKASHHSVTTWMIRRRFTAPALAKRKRRINMEQHDLGKIQKLMEKGKSDKIIKYLSSSDDTVVVAALEALSQIKDEDSVNSIAHMIDHSDAKIRIAAAKALGSIGTEYAKTYLLHRLNTEQDETVKESIKEALHTLAEHH